MNIKKTSTRKEDIKIFGKGKLIQW